MDTDRPGQPGLAESIRYQALVLGAMTALMWLLEIVDVFLLGGSLDGLGIVPRQVEGLKGIVLGPFLHNGFDHVAANTVPFLVLGWLILARRRRDFILVTAIVMLVSGLGTWLTGPGNSVHIGASGLVFGYFGFLFWRSFFERSWPSILLTVVVVMLYGGILFGLLPQGNGVSWQAHLFGFIGGWLAASRIAVD